MPVRSHSPDGVDHNTPSSTWANDPSQELIGRWQPTARHLGWFKYGHNRAAQPNFDVDERPSIDHLDITPQDKGAISRRITDSDNQETYIHRSYRLTEESAVITQLGNDGELVIDRYAEAIDHGQTSGDIKQSEAAKSPGHRRLRFTTRDVETSQDLAVAILPVEPRVRKPISSTKRMLKQPVRPRRSDPLPEEGLNALLNPPHLPSIPLTMDGFQLGLESLEDNPPEHVETFRSYALAKISGLNPSNCDADLLGKIYDAVQHVEQKLQREGRIDDDGYPRTKTGGRYSTSSARSQAMQAWFHDAMLSVDRVVGRHVVMSGKTGSQLIEAPPQAARKKEPVHVMLKTFRLAMYQVMEGRPTIVEETEALQD